MNGGTEAVGDHGLLEDEDWLALFVSTVPRVWEKKVCLNLCLRDCHHDSERITSPCELKVFLSSSMASLLGYDSGTNSR